MQLIAARTKLWISWPIQSLDFPFTPHSHTNRWYTGCSYKTSCSRAYAKGTRGDELHTPGNLLFICRMVKFWINQLTCPSSPIFHADNTGWNSSSQALPAMESWKSTGYRSWLISWQAHNLSHKGPKMLVVAWSVWVGARNKQSSGSLMQKGGLTTSHYLFPPPTLRLIPPLQWFSSSWRCSRTLCRGGNERYIPSLWPMQWKHQQSIWAHHTQIS